MKKLLSAILILASIGAFAFTPAIAYGPMKFYGAWESTGTYPTAFVYNSAGTSSVAVVTFESSAYESGAITQYILESVPVPGKLPNLDSAWAPQS